MDKFSCFCMGAILVSLLNLAFRGESRVPAEPVPCKCVKCIEKQLEYAKVSAKVKAGECVCFDCNCESCVVTHRAGGKQINCACERAKNRELAKCEAKCCEVAK